VPLVRRSIDSNEVRTHSLPVVIGRLVLLGLALAALVSSVWLARAHDRAMTSSTDRYACPMHPQVVSSVPGDCPICGMALERVGDAEHGAPAAIGRNGVDRVLLAVVAQQVRAPASLAKDGVVTAVLYNDDLTGMAPGEHATFFGGASPNMGIDVSFSSDPPVAVDPSTAKVHFRLDAPDAGPQPSAGPNDVGSVQLTMRPRELLVVPTSAVLYSAEGAYVLAAPPDGDTFTKRHITIGRILDSGYVGEQAGASLGGIVVLSGLSEGEKVITEYTFFMDAQRRLQVAHGSGDEVMP
jgi:multidrug efflux pump subunit AcrA (membrane-fusion protein)